jgi:hypothetical protein
MFGIDSLPSLEKQLALQAQKDNRGIATVDIVVLIPILELRQ